MVKRAYHIFYKIIQKLSKFIIYLGIFMYLILEKSLNFHANWQNFNKEINIINSVKNINALSK